MIICSKLLYNLCYTLRIGLEYKEDTVDMIRVYVAPAHFSTCHHIITREIASHSLSENSQVTGFYFANNPYQRTHYPEFISQ